MHRQRLPYNFAAELVTPLNYKIMRANIAEYKAVENAAMKFVKSVAEGNSTYAKELFVDEAVLFGYLDGKLEHGSITILPQCRYGRRRQ